MVYPDLTDHPYDALVSLAGKRAVVTGGAAGLGRQISSRLAEAGAAVLIGDLDGAAAERTAGELSTGGRGVVAAGVDVADAASVEALADRAVTELGGIDVWVNNAGIYPRGSILDISDEDWHLVMRINLDGTFYGSRAAARRMVAAGSPGVIINLVSTGAFNASNGANGAHYIASKHGVAGLTKSIAVQLAGQGIRAVAIAPTLSRTQGVQKDYDAGAGEMLDAYGAGLPAGRLGVPDDVARVVAFAASDLGSFISGSTLAADGGDLAR